MLSLAAASVEHAPAMTALFLDARRAAMPRLPELYTEAEVLRWMAETVIGRSRTILAISAGGRADGFASLRTGWLDHLYVAPEAQGRGVGGALLAAAKEACPEGLRLHVFQSNARARAFYEHRGFRLDALRDGAENEENEPDAAYSWRPSHPASA